ncbi:Oxoglutarate/iron-dependent oxygenase [Cordyceps fumosorosea ARSEF 2679]|uniref:Oxoglutarate/iron-dependent oxygenase n=1 Tax=Cordyceps fumosorosea (strain ARSEF 2679) TaxID=1081104 RepID=A0A167J1P1_CORFA|nr:Oxoglutarate/iron-dependent oxygenase [Cordyceps fumosorosea ARSEF 2679]OAA49695.1 Oxoglutarate/iron-dependent oxygenase [Cordyceps fumosorosea ARSEF 2679]
MSFTSIPILDLAEAQEPATKPEFLKQLRHALMEVGFLYIKNVGIPESLFADVIEQAKAFFDLPEEEKLKIEMKNAPSFLGYSRLAAEITAGAADHREQLDLSTEHPLPSPSAPLHHNLRAPNQWPSAGALPRFRPVLSDYLTRMGAVSRVFTSLVAEAIHLPATAFDAYFDEDQQHKLNPHKDSMLTSYLLQATAHRGLQVQNLGGAWVDCPPVAGTLVVAIGQGLEALTRGACVSTTHRVLSPGAGEGARLSVPFFQGVKADAAFADLEVGGGGEVRRERRAVGDDVEFTFRAGGAARTLGEATLRNRVKSHPDVGERWYPDILREIRAEQAAKAEQKPQADEVVRGDGITHGSSLPAAKVEAH